MSLNDRLITQHFGNYLTSPISGVLSTGLCRPAGAQRAINNIYSSLGLGSARNEKTSTYVTTYAKHTFYDTWRQVYRWLIGYPTLRLSDGTKVLKVLTTHPATFPEICNGLLFRSILRTCVQKLKFVAISVPEKIGGTPKIWAVPGYAHAPFSPRILKGFCSDGPCEYTCHS